MNVQANNNGGAAGGNRKYPNELGYVAEQGIDHFDRHEFREVPVDILEILNTACFKIAAASAVKRTLLEVFSLLTH